MRILKLLLALGLAGALLWEGAARTEAAVDVSSNELQAAADILIPNAESLGQLEGYSRFRFEGKSSVQSGFSARYKALLLADPWLETEVPEIQLLVYSYSNQDAAQTAFEQLGKQAGFSNGQKTVLDQDSHVLFYQSELGGNGVDVFGTVDAEYKALHLVERNGNLIFQASLFRGDGIFDEVNLQTYAEAIAHPEEVRPILSEALDSMQLAVGFLFPPSEAFWTSQSEKSSLNLSEMFEVPSHGSVALKVYVSDPGASVGTILDSSGLSAPSEGDLYLYINSAGKLFAGIYAPNFDADCTQEAGWYRLESASTLYPYEWNSVELHFGVGGFWLELNGTVETSCSVSQPRSAHALYLGDFPSDSLAESMIGVVSAVEILPSKTAAGELWDEVLTEHLFLDLPDTDVDVPIFQYLKAKGVFLGSDGFLSPDALLNRAQMVKVVLKAFNRSADSGTLVPFWDVPIDAWYRKYLAKAYKEGVVTGHEDGSFLPGHEINRAEFLTMLYRLKGSNRLSYEEGTYRDVSKEDWFALGAAFVADHGLYPGAELEPWTLVTRREAARVLYALMNE